MSTYIRGRFRQAFLGCAAGLALSLSAAAASAAPPAKEKEASRLFFGGKYGEALAIYVDLAVETANPIYMCEIGRCHQRLGNLVEARRNVSECLAAAKLTAAKKRQYQAVLAEIDAAATQAPAAPVPPAAGASAPPAPAYDPFASPAPAAPPAPAAAAAPPAPMAPPPGAPPPPAAPPAPGQPGWDPGPYGQYGQPPAHLRQGAPAPAPGGQAWMRPTAFAVGAVGLLGVGAGVYSGLTAKKKFDQVVRIYDDAAYKDGKRYNTYQYIGYGVGAVGLGTAVVLLLKSGGGAQAQASAAGGMTMVVGRDGLALAGSF